MKDIVNKEQLQELLHGNGEIEATKNHSLVLGAPTLANEVNLDEKYVKGGTGIEPEFTDDILRIYLAEIDKIDILTREQTCDYARAIRIGKEAEERLSQRSLSVGERRRIWVDRRRADIARRELIKGNLRLVVGIARKTQPKSGIPLLDVIQFGNEGLMRAVEGFDERKGFAFSTYATWWIRDGITKGVFDSARIIRHPVYLENLKATVRRTIVELKSSLNRQPTAEEIADYMSIEAAKVQEILDLADDADSLDKPVPWHETATVGDTVADTILVAPEEATEQTFLYFDAIAALKKLAPLPRNILASRMGFLDGEPKTYSQVGEEFGLTARKVQLICDQSLERLRQHGGLAHLRDYLVS